MTMPTENIELIARTITIALALSLGSGAAASLHQDGDAPMPVISSYWSCTGLTESDPQAAYEVAEAWRVTGGGLPARHCEALALSGLAQHAEAARSLEEIAAAVSSGGTFEIGGQASDNPRLVAELYAQAGNAWLLADAPENAMAAFSQGLIEAGAAPAAALELYIDRAHAAAAMGLFDLALEDIDRALEQQPGRVDVLVLQATALRATGRPAEAGVALERALLNAPDDIRVLLQRADLRVAEFDDSGAEEDLRRIIALDPDSDTAGSAIRMLEALLDARKRGVFEDPPER